LLPPDELDGLFAQVADGDRAAFGLVFGALYPRVHAVCARITGNGADADDAAQPTMVKLFEQSHRYELGRSALGWALALAVWEARTVSRSNQRRSARSSSDLALDRLEDLGRPADELLADHELEQLLEGAIADLSPAHQAAVQATLRGYIPADAAGAASLRKQRQRALVQLREWFTRRLRPSDPRSP
jgi:RNA polymerase sigma-70 factor (ECF subfamily)